MLNVYRQSYCLANYDPHSHILTIIECSNIGGAFIKQAFSLLGFHVSKYLICKGKHIFMLLVRIKNKLSSFEKSTARYVTLTFPVACHTLMICDGFISFAIN